VIRQEEFNSLLECLTTRLSELESRVLSLYLDGHSYEAIAGRLGCDAKAVDNALQRVKRKVGTHLAARDADPLAARGGERECSGPNGSRNQGCAAQARQGTRGGRTAPRRGRSARRSSVGSPRRRRCRRGGVRPLRRPLVGAPRRRCIASVPLR